MFYPINLFLSDKIRPTVADDVYILGYPFGITNELELPIWKRGSIASEPLIPHNGLPKMLIDTATRSGMSGSPVILMRPGLQKVENWGITMNTQLSLVGVYQGVLEQTMRLVRN